MLSPDKTIGLNEATFDELNHRYATLGTIISDNGEQIRKGSLILQKAIVTGNDEQIAKWDAALKESCREYNAMIYEQAVVGAFIRRLCVEDDWWESVPTFEITEGGHLDIKEMTAINPDDLVMQHTPDVEAVG